MLTKSIIALIALLGMVWAFFTSPIPQNLSYHHFADSKNFMGIPNFMDVVSNLPFIFIGLYGGLLLFRRRQRFDLAEFNLWALFSFGVFAVGFGSSYYHLNPTNASLFWDRLPMALAFMSLFSFIIMDRFSWKWGQILSPFIIATGVLSVVYWYYSELNGHGDLRPYILVQFIPMLIIPLTCLTLPGRFTHTSYIYQALSWYILAKMFEHFDEKVYEVLGRIVSGHTIKHLFSEIGALMIVLYFRNKREA